MQNVIAVAQSGMVALNKKLLALTNDISNAQTVGYKSKRVDFAEIYSQLVKDADQQYELEGTAPQGEAYGMGVRVSGTLMDMSPGTIQTTENAYDLAIQGDGFFQVRMSNGDLAYTRAGNFRLDNNHQLVTPQGYAVEPSITVPQNAVDVTIDTEGRIFVTLDGSSQAQQLGQISLAKFTNPEGLLSVGDNLFMPTDASGEARVGFASHDGFGDVAQFSLENSNVDVVARLAELVLLQRNFDLVTRAITAQNNMLQSAIQVAQA